VEREKSVKHGLALIKISLAKEMQQSSLCSCL